MQVDLLEFMNSRGMKLNVDLLEFMNNRGYAGQVEGISDVWYEPVVTLPNNIVIVLYTSVTDVTPFAQLPELYNRTGFHWSPACTLQRTKPDDQPYHACRMQHLLTMWLIAGGKLRVTGEYALLPEPQTASDHVAAHQAKFLVPVGRRIPETTAPPRDVATAREHQQVSTVSHIGILGTTAALTPTQVSPVNPTVAKTGYVETVPTQASPIGLDGNVATSSAFEPPPETPEKKRRRDSTEFTPTSTLGTSSAVTPMQASPFNLTGNVATSSTPMSSLGTPSAFTPMHALHSNLIGNVATSSTPRNSQHIPASPIYSAQNAVHTSAEMPVLYPQFQHEGFAAPTYPQMQPFSDGMSQQQHPQHAQLQYQAEVQGALMMGNGCHGSIHNGPNHMAVPQATDMESLGTFSAPTPTQAESSSHANQTWVRTGIPANFNLFDLVAFTYVELLTDLQEEMFRMGCRGNPIRVWTIIKEVFVKDKNRWTPRVRPENLEAWEKGMKLLEGRIAAALWRG
jgi:hypothetical protein